ncbi:MAG: hypothetical protein L3J92_05355 [Thermoplasmata archaeon]|jgi:hypothetical protein|nr:hypothetical protein [Thermoplasmata archaeon]
MSEPFSMQFNLRALAADDASWKRPGFYVFVLFLIVVGASWGFLAWIKRSVVFGPGLATTTGQVGLSLILFTFGVMTFVAMGLPRFLSGAICLTVDPTGVVLQYRGRKVERFSWKEGRGFCLLDFSDSPRTVPPNRAYSLDGVHLWTRRTLITKEVMEAILAEASRQAAPVKAYVGNSALYGVSPKIYRITPGDVTN